METVQEQNLLRAWAELQRAIEACSSPRLAEARTFGCLSARMLWRGWDPNTMLDGFFEAWRRVDEERLRRAGSR
jgi:hypothetical protein